jgi:hypothetical protein
MTPGGDDDLLVQEVDLVLAMRDELDQVRMRRPAEALIATGRARQARRWLSGITATLAALAVGLSLGVGGQATARVHVNTVDWSVNTNPDGTVTVTTRNVSDPARLQRVLAEAGVPAIVRYGEICTTSKSLYLPLRTRNTAHGRYRHEPWFEPFEYTFSPASIPPGAVLLISEGLPEHTHDAYSAPFDVLLVYGNWPVTCEQARPPYPATYPRRWWDIPVAVVSGLSP